MGGGLDVRLQQERRGQKDRDRGEVSRSGTISSEFGRVN